MTDRQIERQRQTDKQTDREGDGGREKEGDLAEPKRQEGPTRKKRRKSPPMCV